MTGDSIVRRRTDISITPTADGLYVVDARGGYLFALNATGRAIWDVLVRAERVRAICEQLAQEFSTDVIAIEADVVEFLSALHGAKLVEIDRAP